MSSRPIPAELVPWALEYLSPASAAEPALRLIAGDASNRRYFRLTLAGHPYIVVEAPPTTEKNAEFVNIRKILADAGIRVPELIAADIDRGYLLLEDLGDHQLLPALAPETAAAHYDRAFDILHKMAAVDLAGLVLPAYDLELLGQELGRFEQWFVGALLGYKLNDSERELIARFGRRLLDSALEQPRVLVHRDFHSRNLMLLDHDQLAVIDFQDAVVGPVTYDLASLLKDCYIRWPESRCQQWALDYRDSLCGKGLLAPIDDDAFLRWFDWMALQRHIKVLGTFSRLYLRDGKEAYLDDLPLVIRYTREAAAKYADKEPAFSDFSGWFGEKLSPLIARQPWGAGP